MPTANARKILDRLFRHAWATVILPSNRVLTIEDFFGLFDDVTTVSISLAGRDALESRAVNQLSAVPPTGAVQPQFSVVAGSVRVGIPPPSLGHQLRRPVLESKILALLVENGVAYLHGATGTGKTTQAIRAANVGDGSFLWINCRDAEAAELRMALADAGRRIDLDARLHFMALDDVDLIKHERALEEAAPGLLFTLRRRNGGLLFTAQRPPSQRLCTRLGTASQIELPMPPFDGAEIRELLREFGLQDEQRLDSWSALIIGTTSGHPQLVAARIASLARSGFPAPSSSDVLVTPPEISDARHSARLAVSNQLPYEQKELLYRLSLVTVPFERQRAIALAETLPELPHAGDSFDQLVGPWIERPDLTRYRLSPLLTNAGQDANSPTWARSMHSTIADTWLRFKEQSPWDVATILLSAVIGENSRAIAQLAIGLNGASDEVWKALAQTNALFVHFYSDVGQSFPAKHVHEGYFARWMQLQLAARVSPDSCENILSRIDDELRAGSEDTQVRLFRHMLLMQVLAMPGVVVSASRLIRTITELAEGKLSFSETLQREAKQAGIREEDAVSSTSVEIAPMFGVALIQRIGKLEQLQEAIALLDSMRPSTRIECLTLFRDEPDMGRQWADSLWLSEHESPAPRWRLLVEILDALSIHAIRWGELALAQGVTSTLARTLNEQLKDDAAALATVERTPCTGSTAYLLLDAQAKILLGRGDAPRAREIWRIALKQWEDDPRANPIGLAIAAREAAIAAAREFDWVQSADLFERGASAAARAVDRRFAVGLLADAAHAWFRAGENLRAVRLVASTLEGLQAVPNQPSEDRSYYLHKVVGHLFAWMADKSRWSDRTLDELPPGACSNLEATEKLRDLEPTPLDLSKANLLIFAQASGVPLTEFADVVASLYKSAFPLARFRFIDAQLNESLNASDVRMLPSHIAELIGTLGEIRRQNTEPVASADSPAHQPTLAQSDPEFWMLNLCNGLLALVDHPHDIIEVLETWRGEVIRLKAPPALLHWIDELTLIARSSPRQMLSALVNDDHWSKRVATAALILATEGADPRMLLRAHAHFLMHENNLVFSQLLNRACAAVAAAWRRATERRFALIAPNLNVPSMINACDAVGAPQRKLANIFLAAAPAVDLPIPPEFMDRVRSTAEEGPSVRKGVVQ